MRRPWLTTTVGLILPAVLFMGGARAATAQTPTVQAPKVGHPHGEMTLDCNLCHSEHSWAVDAARTRFDHDTTGFPLEGLHAHVACRECHREPNFAHIGVGCADCHMDAHKGQLGPTCADCHSPTGWVDRTRQQRDHDATRLPLVGAHARVDCDACHTGAVSGEYVGTPADCYACHSETYQSADTPDHVAAGFPTDCDRCHGVFSSTWGRGDFVHPSSFPLTGGHARADCLECHAETFAGTSTECVACHQPQYDATGDPSHVAAGFTTDCAVCHGTNAWQPAIYDHNQTAFPLAGSHRSLDCLACHEAGYADTPTDCYACHQADYENVTDPNHVTAAYPLDCAMCHTTVDWGDANFDHNQTAFPLTGAHRNQDCAACHTAGFSNTPTDCFACHQPEYDATTNPDHAATSFPTTCQTCHTTTAWEPSTWDHEPLFPIARGRHSNIDCLECHVPPANFAGFECIECHEHNQSDTDRDHSEVQNYFYVSVECLECHPRGTN